MLHKKVGKDGTHAEQRSLSDGSKLIEQTSNIKFRFYSEKPELFPIEFVL